MGLLSQDIFAPVSEGMEESDRILSQALLTHDSPPVAALMDHIQQYSGKRLRPALVHLMGRMVGGEKLDELAAIGAMLEALHMATLLHDDVLDGADVRRQVPTLNVLYGNQVPILMGDLIYARTFDLSLKLSTLDASMELSRMTQDLCTGEIEQSSFRFGDSDLDEDRYFRVIRGKTGAMFRAACYLGVVYGGGTKAQEEAASELGMELGTAFQIIDDCLDVVGDEKVAGKSLGTDLETGKVTLPLIRLTRQLPPEGVERLKTIVSGEVEGDRRERLLEEFALDDAVTECHEAADEILRRCLRILENFDPCIERQSIMDVCTFVLERSY